MNVPGTGGDHSSVINAHCPLKATREFLSRFSIHSGDCAIYFQLNLIWNQKESKSEILLFSRFFLELSNLSCLQRDVLFNSSLNSKRWSMEYKIKWYIFDSAFVDKRKYWNMLKCINASSCILWITWNLMDSDVTLWLLREFHIDVECKI